MADAQASAHAHAADEPQAEIGPRIDHEAGDGGEVDERSTATSVATANGSVGPTGGAPGGTTNDPDASSAARRAASPSGGASGADAATPATGGIGISAGTAAAIERSKRRGDDDEDWAFDPPASWLTFRGILANLVFLWRTSLPFRTITISVALTSATVLAVGLIMSNSIASDLYSTRLNDVLAESDRAATQAQTTFHSGVETDSVALLTLQHQAMESANAAAPNAYGYAFYRAGERGESDVLQDLVSERVEPAIISASLRELVRSQPGTQFYQSVTLADTEGERVPGIIVGTLVEVPTAGNYELYFVYSLEQAQQTLDFIQRTLIVSMLVLVLLVGAISGFVMRSVVQPIRVAAMTSRKIAAGRLEQRVTESGEDDIAMLARSFNEMADSLQHQIERLNHLSNVQQRFVSDVSHELRTPLTTIRLAGQMLFDRREEFGPLESRSVELLHDQIERFELLLADLLEISRYDAGHVELLRERHSLAGLADEVIGQMTQVSLDHGSSLVLVAPGGHGESEFDRRRIARVVRNLVGNAIEHGEGKPIVIRVDSNDTAVALSVRDYGVGMSPQQAERAFDRFWRADPSRKRTMGGSGLGLAISHEDAVLHDGRLEVWSAPGLGSNFRLTLPRHVGDEIVLSPLQLEPTDAGATEPVLDAPLAEEQGAFADLDVDTQPIILPSAVDDHDHDVDADVSTRSIDLPTIGAAEPPADHSAPWSDADEVVVVQSAEEVFEIEGVGPDAAHSDDEAAHYIESSAESARHRDGPAIDALLEDGRAADFGEDAGGPAADAVSGPEDGGDRGVADAVDAGDVPTVVWRDEQGRDEQGRDERGRDAPGRDASTPPERAGDER